MKDSSKVIMEPGVVVSERFKNKNIKFFRDGAVQEVSANTIVTDVTVYEYEERLNEQSREILS